MDTDDQAADADGDAGRRVAAFEINLDKLKARTALGVRRAAAFLGIALNSTAGPELPALALTDQSMWRFFPADEPMGVVSAAVAEFKVWIVGNALRELDAHFSQFLDEVWYCLEFAKLSGTSVPFDHVIKGISEDTNAASKYQRIFEAIGSKNEDGDGLRSLSLARNCLSHSHGVVAPRHTNLENALEMRWLGLEGRIQQGEEYVVFGPKIEGMGVQAPDPSKEAEVVLVVVQRSKRFVVGERIVLDPVELHEICFNYLRLTDILLNAFQVFLTARGIGPSEGTNASSS